jgi:SAM-dependent methyltransferase
MQRTDTATYALGILVVLTVTALPAVEHSGAPRGLRSEHSLPSRYPYVVEDVLKHCQPGKGFWIDLGAGKGQVAIPLIEATGNAVVMLDPDAEAMSEGLDAAREKGVGNRLGAVVGVAEAMPLPDNSVDLVVSRGSIFFWDDPVKGLEEVYRVLRPGGKAYIGGGAGSGYPKWAADKLIDQRKQKMSGEEAEKWKRFVELRRPEKMRAWAEAAGLTEFQVMGEGAISAADARVGQGVWILLAKKPDSATRKSEDRVTVRREDKTAVYTVRSPSGIGGATIYRQLGWPEQVVVRLHLGGLESFTAASGNTTLKASVRSHGQHATSLSVVTDGREEPVGQSSDYWTEIQAFDRSGQPVSELPKRGGYFELALPKALLDDDPPSIKLSWIDFYRQ